jgi:hypothetical protein
LRLFKRSTLFYLLILAACSGKGPGSRYHFDLVDPTHPVLYWIPDEEEKILVQKSKWDTLISLFVVQDGEPANTSVSLKAVFRDDTCFVTPNMTLGPTMTFEWQVCLGKDTVKKRFQTPAHRPTDTVTCRIVSVYPLEDSLPSNNLLFHLFFSCPMREDPQAYKYVHIVDEKGKEKPFTWRQKASWADGGKQLIVMIHPGRIKRGINYASESGPLFEPGKAYKLITDEGLLSLDSVAARPYSKVLYIREADRSSPAFKPPTMNRQPAAKSREPLYIAFTEAMDYGAVTLGLTVKDAGGQLVRGHFQAANDSLWLFIPDLPWKTQTYELIYNDYLADLAGNPVNRLFEEESMEKMASEMQVAFRFTAR